MQKSLNQGHNNAGIQKERPVKGSSFKADFVRQTFELGTVVI